MRNWITCIMSMFFVSVMSQANKPLLESTDTSQHLEHEIRLLVYHQQEAWNMGSVDSFMQFYWQSDSLRFISSKGITKGWQPLKDRYLKAYPNAQEMGKLRFSQLDIEIFDKGEVALVTGKWELLEKEKPASGYFQIVLKRINRVWKITTDITN